MWLKIIQKLHKRFTKFWNQKHAKPCSDVVDVDDERGYLQQEKREEVEEIEDMVESYQEICDGITAEDKMIDRAFKREFSDQPTAVVDQLYRHFKKRPR